MSLTARTEISKMVEKIVEKVDISSENLFKSDEDSIDALLKEALEEFKECRIRVQRIAGRLHKCSDVSSATPTLKNLIRELVLPGGGKPLV